MSENGLAHDRRAASFGLLPQVPSQPSQLHGLLTRIP
jgi:hypothetical protein